MWEDRLDEMLDALIQRGAMSVQMPSGKVRVYGDGKGPQVCVRLHDRHLPRAIILRPDLAVGEAYMDERLTIDNDDLHSFFEVVLTNRPTISIAPLWIQRPMEMARHALRRWSQLNPVARSRRNVAHHYDLDAGLYDLFLDDDKQYSCAYFTRPDMSLDDAQIAKKAHIARKLSLEPDMHVLDIGCGWGGMALTLARDFDARVTGVTLSREQHKIAVERVQQAGLADRIDIRLMDYRHLDEQFDRIVSVGMFEHVGAPQFRTYFRTLHDRLSPDGVALIHTIGRMAPPTYTSPFIAKYIFPGGYIPSMSEVSTAVEKEELYLTDIEIWRLHYAETLHHWHDRFMTRIDKARAIYDDKFCRMWRYYLVACEQTFRHGRQCVFQLQLAHDQTAVPLTRDYLYADVREEMRHAAE